MLHLLHLQLSQQKMTSQKASF